MEDTLFSIDVYEDYVDIYGDNLYLISRSEEGNKHQSSQIFMLSMTTILSFGLADYPPDLLNQYVDSFDPSIL